MGHMRLTEQSVPGPSRNYVGYGARAPNVVWPNDAKLVVSLCINYEAGSEYSHPAGDARNDTLTELSYSLSAEHRDLNAESVYEYESRAGVFRLLRLFEEYEVATTFFAAAVAVERQLRRRHHGPLVGADADEPGDGQ